jgi:CubicO group peptidase (beta-lactamase class C family)
MNRLPVLILLITALLLLTKCAPLRVPTIYDGEKLGAQPFDCTKDSEGLPRSFSGIPPLSAWLDPKLSSKYGSVKEMIEATNTTAFLVIHNDSIVYEQYANGINMGDITQVFSVTKVFVTTMLAMAVQDGYIQSIHQPVSDFLPEYTEGDYKDLTLFHLAQMQSGINYDEYGNLLQTVKFYYSKDVSQVIRQPNLKHEPGKVFTYKSIDTQILGTCIEKAVGKPFSEYFYDRLWSKLSPEDTTKWSYDSKQSKELKYYGGLNASARDVAKFGMMVAKDGYYRGDQLLNPEFLNICDDKECRMGAYKYCNGWWYDQCDTVYNTYYGAGFNGQILFINETTGTIIVRLGKNKGGLVWYPILKALSIELSQPSLEPLRATEPSAILEAGQKPASSGRSK